MMVDGFVIPLLKIVDRAERDAGRRHLHGAARAQGHRLGAVAARADARRTVRHPAAGRRRREADDQGRHHADPRRQVGVHGRADHLDGAGADRLRGDSVRPGGEPVRPAGDALHHRHQRRPALHRVGGVGRRLRHHPRRLRVEQQVPAARQPAGVGAAHQLRSRGHADAGQRDPDGRHAQHGRHRPGAGERARVVRVRAAAGVRASSSSAAWPRPTAPRSTCPRRSRS